MKKKTTECIIVDNITVVSGKEQKRY